MSSPTDPFYAMNGCNVGVFSDQQLVIEPFSMWMWGPIGTPGWGGQMVNFTNTLYPDLRTIGLNGMDANPNGAGNMPPDWAYNIHAFANPTTGDVGFILSKQGSTNAITPPAGYTLYRKLMYGCPVYGGKLLTNHTANWPMPMVEFTPQVQVGPAFTSAVTDYPVDVARLIPENSRMGIFRAVITGSGNNLFLSPTGGTAFRKLYCYNSAGVVPNIHSRVQYTYGSPNTSIIYVTFQPGASGRLDLYCDGFLMTEVS